MTSGAGIYFDGRTSARHEVTVEAEPGLLRIRGADGGQIAEWPYVEIEALSAPDHVLRLGRAGSAELARLEIHDPTLAAAIDLHADTLDRTGAAERRTRARIVAWSLAATVSLVLVAVFGLPALADRIAPLIPMSLEHRFGRAMDAQVRSLLDNRKSDKPFECGTADVEKPGRAALDRLIGQLQAGAALPIPLIVAVVRRSETNAIAVPGGHIYVFEGLVRRSRTADELVGVIAHEIGHVAHRDGTRSLLQSAGLSFLFGMLLGDFTGGGVVVIAAKTIAQSAYSREVEAAADRYGVRLMGKIGGNARDYAAILQRIAGAIEPGFKILLDHPQTKDRVAAVEAELAAHPAATRSLISTAEWSALKRICG